MRKTLFYEVLQYNYKYILFGGLFLKVTINVLNEKKLINYILFSINNIYLFIKFQQQITISTRLNKKKKKKQ